MTLDVPACVPQLDELVVGARHEEVLVARRPAHARHPARVRRERALDEATLCTGHTNSRLHASISTTRLSASPLQRRS